MKLTTLCPVLCLALCLGCSVTPKPSIGGLGSGDSLYIGDTQYTIDEIRDSLTSDEINSGRALDQSRHWKLVTLHCVSGFVRETKTVWMSDGGLTVVQHISSPTKPLPQDGREVVYLPPGIIPTVSDITTKHLVFVDSDAIPHNQIVDDGVNTWWLDKARVTQLR